MSCNLPILTTRFGGIVDRFVESSSFKYFNNEEEMIKGIKLIKENKECNSREMIMKDYSWDIVFKNLVNNIVLK
jgi:glycosyltransferase involved in cell wall biosynthesis